MFSIAILMTAFDPLVFRSQPDKDLLERGWYDFLLRDLEEEKERRGAEDQPFKLNLNEVYDSKSLLEAYLSFVKSEKEVFFSIDCHF